MEAAPPEMLPSLWSLPWVCPLGRSCIPTPSLFCSHSVLLSFSPSSFLLSFFPSFIPNRPKGHVARELVGVTLEGVHATVPNRLV